MNRFFYTLVFVFLCFLGFSQQYYIPLATDFNSRYEPFLDSVGSRMHTSLKPYLANEVRADAPFDSLNTRMLSDKKFNKTWLGRKLFSEHLLEVKRADFELSADPVLDLKLGNDFSTKTDFYTNSRGLWLRGTIGERFSFSSYFFDNQANYPSYVDSIILMSGVVPGLARTKTLYGNKDFSFSSAHIAYSLKKYFTFQLGTGKNFIGDGYRSLLLSDYAVFYPFFKVEASIWKIKYMSMWTAFQDLRIGPPPNINPDDFSFRKKYATYHYLDFNIGKKNRASFGIMEAVIWRSDSLRGKGIDFNYLNPIIFLRPVEYSLGSPDNVMLGFTGKYKINSNNILYAQILLDEFKLESVKSNDGDYHNKFGLQAGFKCYNLMGVKNLRVQTEFNYVKPYTYSHRSSITSYGHFNQALAHPLGANFYESVSFINYHLKQWYVQLEIMYVKTGLDTAGLNYGQDIFKSYEKAARFKGNYTAQGLETNIIYFDLKVNYLINANYNLKAEAGITSRRFNNFYHFQENVFIYFGLKTSLFNSYYDF